MQAPGADAWEASAPLQGRGLWGRGADAGLDNPVKSNRGGAEATAMGMARRCSLDQSACWWRELASAWDDGTLNVSFGLLITVGADEAGEQAGARSSPSVGDEARPETPRARNAAKH